MLVTEVF